MVYTTKCGTPAGILLLAADDSSLLGAWFEGQKYFAATLRGTAEEKRTHPVLMQTEQWLKSYFAGENPAISMLPLAPKGSAFRLRVWQMLCEIPYGQVTTYGALAARLAAESGRERFSAQAVGGAVGHNPISVIIPCHRVVGADGSLTGYAGGLEKKQLLLELEGRCLQEKNGFLYDTGDRMGVI